MTRHLVYGWLLVLAGAGWLGAAPTPAPAGDSPPAWGQATGHLQSSLRLNGQAVARGEFRFVLVLRNTGEEAVWLGPAKTVFGWLSVGQGEGQAYYSERWPLASGLPGWQERLPPNQELTFNLGLHGCELYPLNRDMTISDGYPKAPEDQPVTKAGILNQLLEPGRDAVAHWLMYFAPAGEKPLLVKSNALTFKVEPPDLKRMAAAERAQLVQHVVDQFLVSAWSAKKVHPLAVQLGADVVPDLTKPLLDPKTPDYARMWLATALADIGGETAADTLLKLVGDAGVRSVVAYHGVKARDRRLDEALVARAQQAGDPEFTTWVIRGFATFRHSVPEPLLAATLAAADGKVRGSAIWALGQNPTEPHLTRLLGLAASPDENTRGAAATALRNTGRAERRVLETLVKMLDQPGDVARQRACDALDKLTRQQAEHLYDLEGTPEVRAQALKYWQDWWREHAAQYPK